MRVESSNLLQTVKITISPEAYSPKKLFKSMAISRGKGKFNA